MLDLEDIAEVIASAVREATAPISKALEAAVEREAALEARLAAMEAKEAPAVDYEALVRQEVAEAVSAIPALEPVEPLPVDMGAVMELIAKAVADIPLPADGKDCDMEAVEALIAAKIERAVAAIPVAKDGVGLADALIDKDDQLVVTMTDGRTKALGRVVGKDAEIIPPFTLDDFDISQTSERVFEFRFTKGNISHTFEFEVPVPIYRGVYQEGKAFERGDMLTWGGAVWHCDKATTGKPGGEGWTLAVKKGRDARGAN